MQIWLILSVFGFKTEVTLKVIGKERVPANLKVVRGFS